MLGFDCRTFTGLGERETPFLAQTKSYVKKTQGKGVSQWSHRRMKQTCLQLLEGLLQMPGSAVAHFRDGSNGRSSPGRCPLAGVLLNITISPTIETADSRVWFPKAKKITGREHSLTHYQKTGLKFYWT